VFCAQNRNSGVIRAAVPQFMHHAVTLRPYRNPCFMHVLCGHTAIHVSCAGAAAIPQFMLDARTLRPYRNQRQAFRYRGQRFCLLRPARNRVLIACILQTYLCYRCPCILVLQLVIYMRPARNSVSESSARALFLCMLVAACTA
jgi:hypothetical protein